MSFSMLTSYKQRIAVAFLRRSSYSGLIHRHGNQAIFLQMISGVGKIGSKTQDKTATPASAKLPEIASCLVAICPGLPETLRNHHPEMMKLVIREFFDVAEKT